MFLVRSARIADHSDSPSPLGVHDPAICLYHRGGDHWTSDARGHAPGSLTGRTLGRVSKIAELTRRFRKRHSAKTESVSRGIATRYGSSFLQAAMKLTRVTRMALYHPLHIRRAQDSCACGVAAVIPTNRSSRATCRVATSDVLG